MDIPLICAGLSPSPVIDHQIPLPMPAFLRPLALTAALAAPLATAAVQLASPFGDHMVLQRGRPVPVWGAAAPGERVKVEFAEQSASAAAGPDGRWRVNLDPLAASAEPRVFTVKGDASTPSITLRDVLVGEVWLCGGQSNMERQLGPRPPQPEIINWRAEAAAAHLPLIRQLHVRQTLAAGPQENVVATWTVCSPETVVDFTAVGFFFARDLHAALGVPVGILHSSWGGTPAEAWTSREGLADFPAFAPALDSLRQEAADPETARRIHAEKLASWYRANDPGSGDQPWQTPEFEPVGWETMSLPVNWENAGHPDFNGLVWFRRTFELPAAWAGRDLTLRLSAIDDADTTWVNGVEVGATDGWKLPRAYRIPSSALRAGANVIAVRVLDAAGNGGIWDTASPFDLAPADGSAAPLPLAGPWLARFAAPLDWNKRPPTLGGKGSSTPSALYNAMIAPLAPYALRGVAFYQGEANASRATEYRKLLPALIHDWRRVWAQGDFPFLFVQIAPFRDLPPEIREAQLLAWRGTKNTALISTIDVGDANDIHPADKAPVGARLALAARALAYGEAIPYSGPVFAGLHVVDGGRAALTFTHLGGGLVAKDGPLRGFTVAGPDGVFHPAEAVIEGETVVVSASAVPAPVAVRYGWANVADGNLFNVAGLPAPPFRSDAP